MRRGRPPVGRPGPCEATADSERRNLRCAIYTRKSTDEGLEQAFNSLDAQREAAEAYISSQRSDGWVVLPDRYDDGGFSGGTMERPALGRLLADVRAGLVDCIVVYKVDRLSRSLLDFARIMGLFDEQGVSFVSVTQQFNTTSSMGRLTLNVLLSFAQFEREIISERTRDKMSAARRKGRWVGGIPILGYDIDTKGGRLVVNEDEAERVRAIFRLYLEKGALLPTVHELQTRGWRLKSWTTRRGVARSGRPFEKTSLHALLTRVTYVGRVLHKGVVVEGEQPAIIDESIWRQVQERLRTNRADPGEATGDGSVALLRGLLVCGACDAAMTHVHTAKGNRLYRYYVCTHAQKTGWAQCPTKSVSASEIETFVAERLFEIRRDQGVAGRSEGDSQETVGYFGTASHRGSLPEGEPADLEISWPEMSSEERGRVLRQAIARVVVDDGRRTISISLRATGDEALIRNRADLPIEGEATRENGDRTAPRRVGSTRLKSRPGAKGSAAARCG